MRGVGGAAADAEDEEPATAGAEGDKFTDAFFAVVGIELGDNFGGFLEMLLSVGHDIFKNISMSVEKRRAKNPTSVAQVGK
jgi:hypothetical protein